MRALVLAAGQGSRLRPLTDSLPKTLLEVAPGTTILDLAITNLASVGIQDIAIVTGFAANRIEDSAAAMEQRHGVNVHLIHNDRGEIWNNAYSVWTAREWFAEPVVLVNSDTVHPVSVERDIIATASGRDGLFLAVDTVKRLGDEYLEFQVFTREANKRDGIYKNNFDEQEIMNNEIDGQIDELRTDLDNNVAKINEEME